jgi:aspartate dehydrogenase
MAALKLGLIGNGAIARELAKYCAGHEQRFEIVGALAEAGDTKSVGDHRLVERLGDLLDLGPSLVVECAGHAAVKQHGARVLRAGMDLVLVSAGSVCNEHLLAELRQAEIFGKSRLIFVAGALPGFDTLSAAALAGLQSVVLRSSKPPWAWKGTPAEDEQYLSIIKAPTIIFEGSAREAARLFPRNANIAATAALAGIGFEKTHVILVADPSLSQNVHHLEAIGAFGQMVMEIRAYPSPNNPKTSLIAALSIIRVLEQEAAIKQTQKDRMTQIPISSAQSAVAQQEPIVRDIV